MNLGASSTARPTIAWEDDSTLWLAESGDTSPEDFLLVDKTCDFGKSWSGAVNAGSYDSAGILRMNTGMAAVGAVTDTDGSALALIQLSL
jgi:hypothetical protein